ncbi:MAG TPA: HAD family hydrolase [Nitrospiraceae bacterium]|nr:HAD family hydrolase [Nitrospiraceae bacterium]
MTRCVLFDFDGTLIDTWRLYLEAFRRSLAPHFNRLLSDAEILEYQPSAERRMLQRLLEEADFPGYFESFLSHYRALHASHNDGLYPGVHEMLKDLRAQGYGLGVITGKSRAAWDLTFAASGLEPFDVVITDDDVTDPKPHPEGLLAALQTFPFDPLDGVYVGDSLLDCQAAKAAGIPFMAALWSKTGQELNTFKLAVTQLGAKEFLPHPSMLAIRLQAEPRYDLAQRGTAYE